MDARAAPHQRNVRRRTEGGYEGPQTNPGGNGNSYLQAARFLTNNGLVLEGYNQTLAQARQKNPGSEEWVEANRAANILLVEQWQKAQKELDLFKDMLSSHRDHFLYQTGTDMGPTSSNYEPVASWQTAEHLSRELGALAERVEQGYYY